MKLCDKSFAKARNAQGYRNDYWLESPPRGSDPPQPVINRIKGIIYGQIASNNQPMQIALYGRGFNSSRERGNVLLPAFFVSRISGVIARCVERNVMLIRYIGRGTREHALISFKNVCRVLERISRTPAGFASLCWNRETFPTSFASIDIPAR